MPDAGVMCCGGVMTLMSGACVSAVHIAGFGNTVIPPVSMTTVGNGVEAATDAIAENTIVESVTSGAMVTVETLA